MFTLPHQISSSKQGMYTYRTHTNFPTHTYVSLHAHMCFSPRVAPSSSPRAHASPLHARVSPYVRSLLPPTCMWPPTAHTCLSPHAHVTLPLRGVLFLPMRLLPISSLVTTTGSSGGNLAFHLMNDAVPSFSLSSSSLSLLRR